MILKTPLAGSFCVLVGSPSVGRRVGYFSLVVHAAVLWDGGDPELSGSELNFFSGSITEYDLATLGGFRPSRFGDPAILEDESATGANGANIFVVSVAGSIFLNKHCNDCAWCNLYGFAAGSLCIRLA